MFLYSDYNWFYAIISSLLLGVLIIKIICKLTAGISTSDTCLVGKTVLITGGNAGLGYQTALTLAGRGARVLIADKDDATESVRKIIEETGNKNIVYINLDLASLACIRRFAKKINEEESRLDILISNAGIGAVDNHLTDDGLQMIMQVNHFGPFLLTHLLADLLKKSAPSRIIFVSSLLAYTNNLSLENINSSNSNKKLFLRYLFNYGNSKLMNVITSNTIAKKLTDANVTCNSLHPGVVITPIYNKFSPKMSKICGFVIRKIFLPIIGKSVWEGAQTQIELALSKQLQYISGKYFIDCKRVYQPWKTRDKDFCRKLWKMSEKLVHLEEHEKL